MINFLHPGFLFALSAISIPIIIHLFHFRKFKKVWFSNVSFLKQIKTEKHSRNRLKHLIILLLRILAVASLVLAFSQPFIKDKDISLKSGNSAVSIYIDNSFSMENRASDNNLITEAKKTATAIIQGSGNNDQFQVLSNEMNIKQQRFYTKNDIPQLLNETEISPFSRDMKMILLNQSSSLGKENTANKIAYIISDYQKATANIEKIKADKNINTILIPLKAAKSSNLVIDSAWFESPVLRLNQPAGITVRIRNLSDKTAEEESIRLSVNDKEKALSNFTLGAGQSLNLKISFTITNPGWNRGKLYIDDYPVTFDNEFFFCFYVEPVSKILCINGNSSNPYIRAVYGTDSYFSLTEADISHLNYSSFGNYNLIILNEPENISSGLLTEIENFTLEGGNLLFIPSLKDKLNLTFYRPLFERFNIPLFSGIYVKDLKVTEVNSGHILLKNVFEKQTENVNYPSVKKTYTRQSGIYSPEIPLMILENEQPLLTTVQAGKGNVFILSVPLNTEWTNFPRHGLFVPVMYQVALFNTQSTPLYWFIGEHSPIETGTRDSVSVSAFKLFHDDVFFIPDYRKTGGRLQIFQDDNFNKAGFYFILPENIQKADKSRLGTYPVFAMNYDRKESDMNFYSMKELKAIAEENGYKLIQEKPKNMRYLVQNMDRGRPLWKIFIWLTLAFILSEILVIKFWKI